MPQKPPENARKKNAKKNPKTPASSCGLILTENGPNWPSTSAGAAPFHTVFSSSNRNRIWRLRRSRRFSGQLPVALVQEEIKPKFITVENVQALVNIVDVIKGNPACLNFTMPSLTSQRSSVHPGTIMNIRNITQIASCRSLLLKDDTKIFYLRLPKNHPCGNQSGRGGGNRSKDLVTETSVLEDVREDGEEKLLKNGESAGNGEKAPQSVFSAPVIPFRPTKINRQKKQKGYHVAEAIPDSMNIENMNYIMSRSYNNYDRLMNRVNDST